MQVTDSLLLQDAGLNHLLKKVKASTFPNNASLLPQIIAVVRTQRDCPIHGRPSRNLKSIFDHLKYVHNINDDFKQKQLCQVARENYVS